MNERQLELLIQLYDALEELLSDIAEDSTTSTKTLTKLAHLTDESILESVTMNPNTPSHIIEKRLERMCGVGGQEEESRIHMVGNPSLRLQVVRQLAINDPSPNVRDMAGMILAKRMSVLSKTTASKLWDVYKLVVKNSKAVEGNTRLTSATDALFTHSNFPHQKIRTEQRSSKKARGKGT